MYEIHDTIQVCDCCLILVANGDESGCRDYYSHTHKPFDVSGMWAVSDTQGPEGYEWDCAGCGETQNPYTEVHILTLIVA